MVFFPNSLISKQFPDVVSRVRLTLEEDVGAQAEVLQRRLGVEMLDVLAGHLADGRVGALLDDVAEVRTEGRHGVGVAGDLGNGVLGKRKMQKINASPFLSSKVVYCS